MNCFLSIRQEIKQKILLGSAKWRSPVFHAAYPGGGFFRKTVKKFMLFDDKIHSGFSYCRRLSKTMENRDAKLWKRLTVIRLQDSWHLIRAAGKVTGRRLVL